ncbi:MAG: hypothetical protein IPP71_03475 [Bacteroidetes bacterium]|nr:hypothetical protein [Bacteroidota bacterium]
MLYGKCTSYPFQKWKQSGNEMIPYIVQNNSRVGLKLRRRQESGSHRYLQTIDSESIKFDYVNDIGMGELIILLPIFTLSFLGNVVLIAIFAKYSISYEALSFVFNFSSLLSQ